MLPSPLKVSLILISSHKPIELNEASGIRLAVLFKALAPLSTVDAIQAMIRRIAAMSVVAPVSKSLEREKSGARAIGEALSSRRKQTHVRPAPRDRLRTWVQQERTDA